jgi:hypothetical protein
MSDKPSVHKTLLKPSKLGAVASALALLAGILGLMSAFFQSQQLFDLAFWLRLLISVGFLLSGTFQIMARIEINRKLKALNEQDHP